MNQDLNLSQSGLDGGSLHYQSLEIGPPALWVARFGLPTSGVLLDSGLDSSADYADVDALALTPRETLCFEGDPSGESASSESDLYQALERWSARPWVTREGGEIQPDAWERLGESLALPLPMTMCALSYELGAERLGAAPQSAPHPAPKIWAARYEAIYLWCRRRHKGFVIGESERAARELVSRLETPLAEQRSSGEHPLARAKHNPWLNQEDALTEGALRPHMGWPAYRAAMRETQELLRRGEVYQINLTLPMTTKLKPGVTLEELFIRLREVNSGQFSAVFRFDEQRAVISLSPERLARWGSPHPEREGRLIETAPIKGTRPRRERPDLDRAEADALIKSEKDQAEHVMILDLERNDLGRICETGSVEVVEDRALKSYATVHHLVSVVRGALREDVGLAELLSAIFPGGSVTGAPKRRAIEQIRALEVGPRGLYCGALGYLDPRGGGDLNIPIRTAFIHHDRLTYHAGGGVVADSTARDEWEELWVKTRGIQSGLGEERS